MVLTCVEDGQRDSFSQESVSVGLEQAVWEEWSCFWVIQEEGAAPCPLLGAVRLLPGQEGRELRELASCRSVV